MMGDQATWVENRWSLGSAKVQMSLILRPWKVMKSLGLKSFDIFFDIFLDIEWLGTADVKILKFGVGQSCSHKNFGQICFKVRAHPWLNGWFECSMAILFLFLHLNQTLNILASLFYLIFDSTVKCSHFSQFGELKSLVIDQGRWRLRASALVPWMKHDEHIFNWDYLQ